MGMKLFSTEPDMAPCTESSVIEIASNGTMEEKLSVIVTLLLKKLAQVLWPKASAKTTSRGTRTASLRVTNMAVLALSRLPAPSSFETLVLLQNAICLRTRTFKLRDRNPGCFIGVWTRKFKLIDYDNRTTLLWDLTSVGRKTKHSW